MVKYEYIAKKLRELRKARGLSTEELGAMVDRSNKTIEAYEACISQPNADMMIDLCAALDVDISAFFGGSSDMSSETLSPDERELITMYRQMDSRARHDLMQIAASLSASAGDSVSQDDVKEAM